MIRGALAIPISKPLPPTGPCTKHPECEGGRLGDGPRYLCEGCEKARNNTAPADGTVCVESREGTIPVALRDGLWTNGVALL